MGGPPPEWAGPYHRPPPGPGCWGPHCHGPPPAAAAWGPPVMTWGPPPEHGWYEDSWDDAAGVAEPEGKGKQRRVILASIWQIMLLIFNSRKFNLA